MIQVAGRLDMLGKTGTGAAEGEADLGLRA